MTNVLKLARCRLAELFTTAAALGLLLVLHELAHLMTH